jgi:glutaredoxin 3
MADVEIYSSPFCGYCFRAKRLLDSKGVVYDEIDVIANPNRRPEMTARAGGGASVPQIFIDGRHIGGSDELMALESAGELDRLLAAEK